MTKYREILRLHSLEINQTCTAESCGCSRKTVRNVLNRAKELEIEWPLKAEITDAELEKQLFSEKSVQEPSRKRPDYDHIAREMMRNGVTLKLLWNEYCEECRQGKELPLHVSSVLFYYHKCSEKSVSPYISSLNQEASLGSGANRSRSSSSSSARTLSWVAEASRL